MKHGITTTALLLTLLGPCIAAARGALPTADEIVKRLESALDVFSRQHIVAESATEVDDSSLGKSYRRVLGEYATDGKDQSFYSLSSWTLPRKDAEARPEAAHRLVYFWNGRSAYEYFDPPGVPESRSIVVADSKQLMDRAARTRPGVELDGILNGDIEAIPIILRRSELTVRPALEQAGGRDCHVLEAQGADGHYILWIDTERGHIIKAELTKRGDDRYIGQPLSTPQEYRPGLRFTISEYSMSMLASEFRQIGERWVPMTATIERRALFDSGRTQIQHSIVTRKSVELDRIADQVFAVQFPDGIRASKYGYDGPIQWRLIQGKLVPLVDEGARERIDKSVQEFRLHQRAQ